MISSYHSGIINSSSSEKLNRTSGITSKPHRSNGSMENRGKKIVAMPASLYNHFRPVESNIPIEDMSQFLYFGQKLRGTGRSFSSLSSSPLPPFFSCHSKVTRLAFTLFAARDNTADFFPFARVYDVSMTKGYAALAGLHTGLSTICLTV